MFAANFSDPENARIIYLAAVGLVVMAVALVAGTVWWWRSSAVEHPALGPLEVMSSKSYVVSDDESRHELIESARPGFEPVLADDELMLEESLDEVFPDGLPTVVAPAAPSRATRVQPVVFDDELDDSFPEPVADPFDDPFAGVAADRPGAWGQGAAETDRAAGDDLEAMADDIWGPSDDAPRQARPIDPLLRSDDIW